MSHSPRSGLRQTPGRNGPGGGCSAGCRAVSAARRASGRRRGYSAAAEADEGAAPLRGPAHAFSAACRAARRSRAARGLGPLVPAPAMV